MLPFANFWQDLSYSLITQQTISNWTKDGKIRTQSFQAQYKGGSYVICTIRSGKELQVPRKEFHSMYDRWEDYISDRLSRSYLRDESRFTKYTISIIHHYLHLTQK
ncbi:MAG: hypothetical protein HY223_02470 [Thaumarchaeota archaeon]|nr:hypothetical protein [Nitrososphaerota archaeon]